MFGIRRGSAILRAPADGDGGTGGGGAAPAFTEEQQAFLGQLVNQAVTGQLKRNLPGAIGEGLKGINWKETLGPVIAEAIPKPAEGSGGDTDDGKGKGGKSKGDSALERQISDLATKLEQSEARATAADKARIDAEQKRLLDGATGAFRNGLQPKLRADLLDVAVGHFGREIKLAEDGSPLLRVKRAPYKGAPEEDADVPLAEALPILLASESMKPFLPAPGGGGDGKGRGNAGPTRPAFGGAGGGAGPTDPIGKTIAEFEARGISLEDA